jgi:FkbM family methyltransferase
LALELGDWADVTTAWTIFCKREYQVPERPRVVVDLGANFGAFALSLAITWPEVLVFALEPSPVTFQRLCRHVAASGCDSRVACWQFAVARTNELRMFQVGLPSHSHHLLSPGVTCSSAVSVEALNLPEVLARVGFATNSSPIDFLKMDIEGAEHECLADLPPGVLSSVRAAGIEYHPSGEVERLFSSLAAQGLRCIKDCPIAPGFGVAHFARTS